MDDDATTLCDRCRVRYPEPEIAAVFLDAGLAFCEGCWGDF